MHYHQWSQQRCHTTLTHAAFILSLLVYVHMQDKQLDGDCKKLAYETWLDFDGDCHLFPKLEAAAPSSSQLGANSSQSSLVHTDLVLNKASDYIIRVYVINGVEFKLLPSSSNPNKLDVSLLYLFWDFGNNN